MQTSISQAICHSSCPNQKCPTALFGVSKTICAESTYFFYSHCVFHASDKPNCKVFDSILDRDRAERLVNLRTSLDELHPFLLSIGPPNRQSIRRLKVSLGFDKPVHLNLFLTKSFALLSREGHGLRFLTFHFACIKTLNALMESDQDLEVEMAKMHGLEKVAFILACPNCYNVGCGDGTVEQIVVQRARRCSDACRWSGRDCGKVREMIKTVSKEEARVWSRRST